MLFMVIERFRDDDMVPIYQRVRDGGRFIPDGLKYIDSWVEPNRSGSGRASTHAVDGIHVTKKGKPAQNWRRKMAICSC